MYVYMLKVKINDILRSSYDRSMQGSVRFWILRGNLYSPMAAVST